MDDKPELRKRQDYAVGDWVLFTAGASYHRPGYVQVRKGGSALGGTVRYEIRYKRWIPAQRSKSGDDPVILCTAGQLVKVIDPELSQSEFMKLGPDEVGRRYFGQGA